MDALAKHKEKEPFGCFCSQPSPCWFNNTGRNYDLRSKHTPLKHSSKSSMFYLKILMPKNNHILYQTATLDFIYLTSNK